MALIVANRVKENTSTTGVGGITFTGSPNGFQPFSGVMTNGDITYYVIEENDKWEVGIGTFGSNNMTRTTILTSSNGGNAISLGGSGVVSLTYPAEKATYLNQNDEFVLGASGLLFTNGTVFKEAKLVELTDVRLSGTPSHSTLVNFNVGAQALSIGDLVGGTNSYNVHIGHGAAAGTTSAHSNVVIGAEAAKNNKTGFKNVHIGHLSGPSDTNAATLVYNAVSVGHQAGSRMRQDTTAIGYLAGHDAYEVGFVAIGSEAGSGIGSYSVGIGNQAMHSYSDDYAVSVGYQAGHGGGGENAVWIGNAAGKSSTAAERSIGIGKSAGQSSTGDDAIYIGNSAGKSNTSDDYLFIGNGAPSSSRTLIKGDMQSKRLAIGAADVALADTLYVGISSSSDKGLVVKGAPSQSADLTQWVTSADAPVASISNSGVITANALFASGQGLELASATPITTANTLYNVGGDLYFNGGAVSSTVSTADLTYVSGIAVYGSGQAQSLGHASGVAAYASGQATSLNYASGLTATNATNITTTTAVANYASGQATSLNYASGLTATNATNITATTAVANYASGQATSLNVASGVANYASGNTSNIHFGSNAEGDLLYHDGSKFIRLPKGTDSHVLTMDGNVPAWEAATGGGGDVTTAQLEYVSGVAVYGSGQAQSLGYASGVAVYASGQATSLNYASGLTATNASNISTNTTNITATTSVANYASGQATSLNVASGVANYASGNTANISFGSDAQGDILYHDGTNYTRLPAGTTGYFLKTQGTSANPVWAEVTGGGDVTTAQLEYVSGVAVYGSGQAQSLGYASGVAAYASGQATSLNYASGLTATNASNISTNTTNITSTTAVANYASGQATSLNVASGIANYASGQVNVVDGVAEASKAIVLDSAKSFAGVKDGVFNEFDSWVRASGVDVGASGIVMRDADLSHAITIKAPDVVSTSYTLPLPSGIGTNGQVLTTDGIQTYWSTVSGGGGGDIEGVTAGNGLSGGGTSGTVTLNVEAAQTVITSIYATDLIMGEDAQTAIDFGTENEIDFKVDNANRLTLTSSSLYPETTNQIDLGTSSLEFKDAYFDGTVTSDAFAGPLTGDVTGNADTATALANGRTIGMTGHVVWTSASFDGTGNVTGTSAIQADAVETAMIEDDAVTADKLAHTAVTAGSYTAADITVDAQGRITAAANGTIALGSEVSGTLPVANGGTGQTSYTNGQLLIGNTTGNTLAKATLTAGSNVTITNGTGTISIAATDTNTTYTAGDGLDLSGTEFSTDLKANGGLVIESTEIAVDLGASSITGTLSVGDGGTGATSLDDITSASTLLTVTAGADTIIGGDVTLTVNQGNFDLDSIGGSLGLTDQVTGTLPVANGGTGASSLADKAVLITQDSGTDTVSAAVMDANGELLIGGTDGPAVATLTQGSNVTITNGNGSITIAATDTNTTYSAATSSALGLMKLEDDTEQSVAANAVSATAGRTYGVQFNSSDQAVVNVPWTDTNTTYTAGDGLDLSGTEFSADLKSNGGLVIESNELAVDLGASSMTGTLAVGDGGTGSTSASAARTALGVAIGSNVQAHDAELDTLAALTEARGSIILGDSTPAWSALAIGSANTVLTSDGTDASWSSSFPNIANYASGQATSLNYASGVAAYASGRVTPLLDGLTQSDFTLTSSTASKPVFTVQNTHAGGAGSSIVLEKNGGSPAANDTCGSVIIKAKDAGDNSVELLNMKSRTRTVGDGTADGETHFSVLQDGSARFYMGFNTGDSPDEIHFYQPFNIDGSTGGWKIGGTSVSATAAQLNYSVGVTSAIQTQLDTKGRTKRTDSGPAAGGVAIWSDAETITADSGNLYWDASNDRLGVGTGAPTSTLAVSGNLSFKPVTITDSAGQGDLNWTAANKQYAVSGVAAYYLCETGNTSRTINLPDPAIGLAGRTYSFKKIDSGTGTVTIQPYDDTGSAPAGGYIDGDNATVDDGTNILWAQYDTISCTCAEGTTDGRFEWHIVQEKVAPHTCMMTMEGASGTFAQTTPHKVLFDSSKYDMGGSGSDANMLTTAGSDARVTIKRKGRYNISSQIAFDNTFDVAEFFRIDIYINGAQTFGGSSYQSAASDQYVYGAVDKTLELDVDDYIQIYFYHNDSGNDAVIYNKAEDPSDRTIWDPFVAVSEVSK